MHISHILEKKLLWYSRPSLALYPRIYPLICIFLLIPDLISRLQDRSTTGEPSSKEGRNSQSSYVEL